MRLALLALASASLLMCGGTIKPGTDDAKHIECGKRFKHVALIRVVGDKPTGVAIASCVVIGPRHILTAAHAVFGTDEWVVSVDGEKDRRLKSVSIHPSFGKGGGSFDIAVGVAEEDFSFGEYPAIYAGDREEGMVADIVGYGMTGNFRDGIVSHDNNRRGGTNVIDHAVNDYLICSIKGEPWTDLEFCICAGDSGGGLFIDGSLAGINSCIMAEGRKPGAIYGDESSHVRLSVHREWILGEMAK
jgi:hypothetical protein